jgi:rubrerythrin
VPAKKKTTKKSLSAAEGLSVAIQTEIEGVEFYKVAAQKTKDDGAKKMFESLADDEVRHRDMLNDQYQLMIQGKEFKPMKKSPKSKLKFRSPVFSKVFLESRKKKNFEMSALSIGILLEQNAIDFYREQKNKAREPKVKKFFAELAEWEGQHLRALIAQKRFLQRAIFDEARFEPF